MGVATSSFNSTVPSGSSSIRQGDDDIRSTKSIVQAVINDEHYFDNASASSASGGVHKPGSARVFVNATRASLATPASADSKGRLVFCEDQGSLHYLGSSSHSTIVGGTQPYGAIVYGNDRPMTNNANSELTFAAEQYDVGGYFASAGSSAFRIPAGLQGLYVITAHAEISSVTSCTKRLTINRDGVPIVGQSSWGADPSTATCRLTASLIEHASANTAYTATFFQDSGVNTSLVTARMTLTRIG